MANEFIRVTVKRSGLKHLVPLMRIVDISERRSKESGATISIMKGGLEVQLNVTESLDEIASLIKNAIVPDEPRALR